MKISLQFFCFQKIFVSGLVPLNIELQQDDRTDCCGHNTVTERLGFKANSNSFQPRAALTATALKMDNTKDEAEKPHFLVVAASSCGARFLVEAALQPRRDGHLLSPRRGWGPG